VAPKTVLPSMEFEAYSAHFISTASRSKITFSVTVVQLVSDRTDPKEREQLTDAPYAGPAVASSATTSTKFVLFNGSAKCTMRYISSAKMGLVPLFKTLMGWGKQTLDCNPRVWSLRMEYPRRVSAFTAMVTDASSVSPVVAVRKIFMGGEAHCGL
jgi:hypothetical protein